MSNETYTEKVSVNINTSTLSQIDLLVDHGYYSNRSDFINQALREGLHRHQHTLDRIIDGQTTQTDAGHGKRNPWFVGVYHFDSRTLAEIEAGGEAGSITGYGVLAIDEEVEEAELFEYVKSIKIKGKVIASPSIKQHYGLK